ncbi:MAG: glycosyltransferase family 4 protein [Pyrinomonadaceae bacterium]
MKILITAPSLEICQNVSGISSVVRRIIQHSRFDFEHFQAGRKDGEKANISWIFKQILSVPRFYRKIISEKIDIVHINTALNPLSILRDAAFVKMACLAKRPILLHLHGGKFLAQEFENRFLVRIAEKMLKMASVVVVLSELEKEIIERRWQNLNVRVLENAVAPGKEVYGKRKTGEKTIIFLGRLHESKGLHEIVEVCRILKNENFKFRFNCFGAGDLKDYFVSEMTKILGEKFYYGGVVSGAEKEKALNEADIFLLPSRYGEGLPMAMLEAMAAKCVVVISEMASIGAVVKDGINGFTVEPQNVPQLVGKLKSLLANEKDWESLRKNARATIEKKFNLDDYIRKLENMYTEIKS